MNIVCGIDDKFVIPCGVLMTSVFENNKDENIIFYIITQGLLPKNVRDLQEIAQSYHQGLSIVLVDCGILKDCPTESHISMAAYNRILAANILPSNIEKCLYLDADMIVHGAIGELYRSELKSASVGVVIDQSGDDIRHYNRLNYNREKGYFNSGLLLMNLKIWREKSLPNEILKYIDSHKDNLLLHDQDALNFVLKDSTLYLPMKYNMQFSFLFRTPFIARFRWVDMYFAAENPIIIHYTNRIKPWHRECIHPYKNIWRMYYSQTKWKNKKLQIYSTKGYCRILIEELLNFLRIKKLMPPIMLRKEFYKFYI